MNRPIAHSYRKECESRPRLLLATALLLPTLSARAENLPRQIMYEGSLTQNGSTVNGNVTLVLRLTTADGSTQFWTSGPRTVAVSTGLYHYPLGGDATFDAIDWASATPYVEVTVNGTLLLPRDPLWHVPYALLADALKPGTTIQGPMLDMGGNRITGVGTPVNGADAANKAYVDSATAGSGARALSSSSNAISSANGDTSVNVEQTPNDGMVRLASRNTQLVQVNEAPLTKPNANQEATVLVSNGGASLNFTGSGQPIGLYVLANNRTTSSASMSGIKAFVTTDGGANNTNTGDFSTDVRITNGEHISSGFNTTCNAGCGYGAHVWGTDTHVTSQTGSADTPQMAGAEIGAHINLDPSAGTPTHNGVTVESDPNWATALNIMAFQNRHGGYTRKIGNAIWGFGKTSDGLEPWVNFIRYQFSAQGSNSDPDYFIVKGNGDTGLPQDGAHLFLGGSDAGLNGRTSLSLRGGSAVGLMDIIGNGRLGLGTISSHDLMFYTANTDRMTLTSGGNVGIGTSSPGQRLTVAGAIQSTSGGFMFPDGSVQTSAATGGSFNTNGDVIRGSDNIPVMTWVPNGGNTTVSLGGGTQWGHGPQTNWNLQVFGSFSATSKSFDIPHPLAPKTKRLVHGTLEGPELGVYYRGTARLVEGKAVIELPSYFAALTSKQGETILLTNVDGFDRLAVKSTAGSQIKDGRFVVYAENPRSTQAFNWEVKATRSDVPALEVERDVR